jgi:hypothetical protein
MIMGGTQGVGAGTAPNAYYEIWNPSLPNITRQLLVDPSTLSRIKQNYYPFNYVLPSGDLFNSCNGISWIMDPYSAKYKVSQSQGMLQIRQSLTFVASGFCPWQATLPSQPLNHLPHTIPLHWIFCDADVEAREQL